jgi:hypothetical protein
MGFELGKEQTVEAAGRTWTFGRLEKRVVDKFRDWIVQQVGDPFTLADRYLSKIPEGEWTRLFREACDVRDQLQAFSMGSPLAQKFLNTELGGGKALHLMLLTNHPDAKEEDAFAIANELGRQATAEALAKAQGQVPGPPAKNEASSASA